MLVEDAAYFRVLGLAPLTEADLIRHAERFGTDSVAETGEAYLDPQALERVYLELDSIDVQASKGHRFVKPTARRSSSETTAAAVRELRAEGLLPMAIADRLGIKDSQVRRALAQPAKTASQP